MYILYNYIGIIIMCNNLLDQMDLFMYMYIHAYINE